MRDRFDYAFYWRLLERLLRTHRPLRFADVATGLPDDMFFLLRHDVDYSTRAALELAVQESRHSVRATYFLLPNGIYYNLLDAAHAEIPRRLVGLGHEVGLHYDVNFLYRFPQAEWIDMLRRQAALLESLSGAPVRAIAMHQPGLNGTDPLRHRTEYLNAYDDRFFREMPYISDSCRAWRDEAWDLLDSDDLPRRFQLALHPVNWSPDDRDRQEVFKAVHRELVASIETASWALLNDIDQHPAVIQHEERAVRRAAAARGLDV